MGFTSNAGVANRAGAARRQSTTARWQRTSQTPCQRWPARRCSQSEMGGSSDEHPGLAPTPDEPAPHTGGEALGSLLVSATAGGKGRVSIEFLITSLIIIATPGTGVLYTLA